MSEENLSDVKDSRGSIELDASSSSMLPVAYGVNGPATLNGETLMIIGSGVVNV